VENAVSSNEEYIKAETLTAVLNFEEELDEGIAIAFDEVNTKLFIQKH
jgi:isoleucyl-tRNA synthetase